MRHRCWLLLIVWRCFTFAVLWLCAAPAFGDTRAAGSPLKPSSRPPQQGNVLDVPRALVENLGERALELQRRGGRSGVDPKDPVVGRYAPRPPALKRKPRAAVKGYTIHGAAGEPRDLDGYLGLLARTSPGGWVSGRFADWRTPSVYRLVGGLHNGYDIAFPRGTPIVSGWYGWVSAIVPWYEGEYGITVDSPAGFRTTYGHLAPRIWVGAVVRPGDVLGVVARDHVDIKMRDRDGLFVDFANGIPYGSGPPMVAYSGRAAAVRYKPPPPLRGDYWTRKPVAVEAALTYLRLRYQEALVLKSGSLGGLPALHARLADAQRRLLRERVPEQVLLAAFLDAATTRDERFFVGVPVAANAEVDAVTQSLRRRALLDKAQRAMPKLKRLLSDLGV